MAFKPKMPTKGWTLLDSGCFEKCRYDWETGLLEVVFRDSKGTPYSYKKVPLLQYRLFISAGSKYRFWKTYLKGRYQD